MTTKVERLAVALEDIADGPQSHDTEQALLEAAALLRSQAAELARMEGVCDSYAAENQRLYDRATAAEAALIRNQTKGE